MNTKIEKQSVTELTAGIEELWKNFVVGNINDHVVRLSVLQRDFHWHSHSESDEFFYVISGTLYVDFEEYTVTLNQGEMITVPKNILHRTRSEKRTTLLCFESKANDVSGD